MRRASWLALFCCLWLPLVATAQAAVAQRVISLAPSLTELAYSAGLGDKLVGVSAYSDYPPQAAKLEQVASWQGVNVERILALKPDLILAWRGGNPQRQLDQLASFGIPVLYLDPQSIEQVALALEQLAHYSAAPQQARDTANSLRQHQTELKMKYARAKPLPVFIQFGTQPLFTTSAKTLQNEVVSLCGAENIFANSPVPWPQVSREQVLMRQPQAIIIAGSIDQQKNVTAFWHSSLQAPVITLNPDWFSRPGPRIILAAKQLCYKLTQLSAQ